MRKIISTSTKEARLVVFFTIMMILSLCLSVTISCSAQNCNDLPNTFKSYTEAETKIKNAKFAYVDEVSTSGSSWIRGAKYYSCDGKSGFFLMKTGNGKSYLFQGMPIAVWRGFKEAKSYGTFYNERIRNRYRLKLTP